MAASGRPLLVLICACFLAKALASTCWSCLDDYAYPTKCAAGTVLNPVTEKDCPRWGCCSTNFCCEAPASSTCDYATSGGGCCARFQTRCERLRVYTAPRIGQDNYGTNCITPPTPNNVATWSCPLFHTLHATYAPGTQNAASLRAGFCVPTNCQTVSSVDCARCIECRSGFSFVSDGSCQGKPTITGTVFGNQVSSLITTSEVLTVNASGGSASSSLTVSLNVATPGQRAVAGAAAPVTINTAASSCMLNGARVASITAAGALSFSLSINIGTSTLVCTVTDSNGLAATVSKTIALVDNEPPLITCTPRTFTTDTSNFATFAWPTTALASDAQLRGSVCAGGPSNNVFPVGVTTISCWAWDFSFNVSCTYTVTVVDNVPASITCPPSRQLTTVSGQSYGLTTFPVTASDNVRVTQGPSCTANNLTQFPVGNTTVSCTAKDAANDAVSCSFLITVADEEAPRISCPSALNLSLNGLTTSQQQTGTLTVTATDNAFLNPITCGSQPMINTGSHLAATGTITNSFSLGTTSITCTVTDRAGNSAACSTTVTVRDLTPPVIVCTNSLLNTLPNVNFSTLPQSFQVTAVDNVGLFNTSCSVSNTTQFPIGVTPVTCTARDWAGNTASCPLTVTVVDRQAPTVQCPSTSITVSTLNTSNIRVTIPPLNATDNAGILNTSLSLIENSLPATARTLPGNTTSIVVLEQWTVLLTFTAVDTSGNAASCNFVVSVFPATQAPDDEPPVIINCPANSTFSTTPSPDFLSPMYANARLYNLSTLPTLRYNVLTWPALNATDNSGSVASGYLVWSPNPATAATGLPAGRYVVAYGATDRRGNSAFCAFRVQVLDLEAPTWLRCAANQNYDTGNNPGSLASMWPLGGLFAVDNVGVPVPEGSCTSIPSGFCPPPGQAPSMMFPVGTVQFTYTAVDSSGNQAAPCRFNVTVRDTGAPTIPSCPPQTTIIASSTDLGSNSADISLRCPLLLPADNVPQSQVGLRFESTPPGFNCSSRFPVGTTVLTARAVDAVGLTSVPCYTVVSVTDDQPPVIANCPANVIVVNCSAGLPNALVTLPAITATDNACVPRIQSTPAGFLPGQTYNFSTGLTTVTFRATDESATGNPVACDVRIFVNDTQPPIIYNFPGAPGNEFAVQLETDAGQPTATYTIPPLFATDNVGLAFSGLDVVGYAPGQTVALSVGTLRLRYTAQDTNFNSVSVTIVLTVVDRERPVQTGCPSSSPSNIATLLFNTTAGQATRQVNWTITAQDNSRKRVLTYVTSDPVGFSRESFFPVGTTMISQFAVDVYGNTQNCTFYVVVEDREPPTIQCPDNLTVTTADSTAAVQWRTVVATDNSGPGIAVNSSMEAGNYSTGLYRVSNTAQDPSGNIATCTFYFSVEQTRSSDAGSSAASTGTLIAGGAGGGIALLALVAVVLLFLTRRNYQRKMQAASSGYAELMAMSDDFVLERARAIQQALVDQRAADPPAAVNAQFVHPTRKFAAPPTTLAELEEYIRETVRKELSRDAIEFGPELGSGEFGAVFRGEHVATDLESGALSKQTVAIKLLKNSTKDEDKVRFLKEAAIMAQFSHPNIVGLVGVCTLPTTEPTLIVLEYMHLGSLHGYLQSPMVKGQLETLTMLRMALDIGSAMQYLAEAGFVHRDLAARNVLLDESMNCRVGDFGLSVDLAAASSENEGGIYSGDEGAKIPVRWASIEAICFRQFSTASDVWSYGVLLWEIWSYAEMPYKGWPNKRVTEQVCEGYRLEKPSACPDEVYRIMIDCWNKNVKRRATFASVNRTLVQIWKDVAIEAHPTAGDGGNLYDVGEDDGAPAAGKPAAAGTALYDMGEDIKPKAQPATRAAQQVALYDTGDNDMDTEEAPTRAPPSRASLATVTTRLSDTEGGAARGASGGALYDVASGNSGTGSSDGGYLAVDADDLA